jgi:outer membrane protein TolC
MRHILTGLMALLAAPVSAAEWNYPDLPQQTQVERALNDHVNVVTATTGIKVEKTNRRKLDNGDYEFNLRAGSAQRKVVSAGQNLREWNVELERPVRLPGKAQLDSDIGAEGEARADYMLGVARQEAGRELLRLWFNWLRERSQRNHWQQQVDILMQQAQMTEKRVKAGDAPKMELNQAQAAVMQASVSLQQAKMRTQLAASEITRQFPALVLAEQSTLLEPQPIEHDFPYWKERVFEHNYEFGVAQSDSRIQRLQAQRSRADRLPDPTLGVRYSSDYGGAEHVTGVYFSVPLSFGLRSTTAEGAGYQAEIVATREEAVKRKLESDAYATYTQAVSGYDAWRQANEAAVSNHQNAELVAHAYSLGESSLFDTLIARRLALESALAATMAQLDANEARYRLLLDAHQLWPLDAP